jgi:beta-aspartyl-peptidase (threonine type)
MSQKSRIKSRFPIFLLFSCLVCGYQVGLGTGLSIGAAMPRPHRVNRGQAQPIPTRRLRRETQWARRIEAAQIRAVLDAQVAAWNAGQLEEFMAGYWRSPELTFFSGGRQLAGWDATLERYRQSYQTGGKEMGKLEFSELEILPLGKGSALVRGRWGLSLSDGKTPGGLFTLIFRRFKNGWKIVHDHTSSNQ